MKRSSRISLIIAFIVSILTASGYWWLFHSGRQDPKKNSANLTEREIDEPVARVRTVIIKRGTITEDITVYGSVIPAPGAAQTISVPFESQIHHVMVNDGQRVSIGDVLLEIDPSPNTYLQFEQARNTYELAKQSLKHMQQRFDLRLATNDQLLQAKQAFQQAKLSLESMKKQGINSQKKIRSDVVGLVSKVYVKEGAIVPAGNPLIEIVAQSRLEVQLGIEPEDINHVQMNQTVSLIHVGVPASHEVAGRIGKISRSVNPATRLVDVFVALPPSAEFMLGEYILGKITIASAQGLIVPRAAVLPEGNRYILFTIKDGHAVKHIVQVGVENEREVEVIGRDIRPGDPAVFLGNYELKDGMSVKVGVSQ